MPKWITFKFIMHCLVAFWAIFIAGILIAKFEGYIFPVVTDFEIVNITPYKSGWSTVAGKFEKQRDCVFEGVRWYSGYESFGNNSSVLVTSFFDDKPQIRNEGFQSFDLLRVQIDPDRIEGNSYAYVFHKCPWRGWRTKTVFYP